MLDLRDLILFFLSTVLLESAKNPCCVPTSILIESKLKHKQYYWIFLFTFALLFVYVFLLFF